MWGGGGEGEGLRLTDSYTFTKPGPYKQTFKNKGDANFRD